MASEHKRTCVVLFDFPTPPDKFPFIFQTIMPFEVKRAGLSPRGRNDDEKAKGELPLPLPSILDEGFRFYMVNRIKVRACTPASARQY